MVRPIGDMLGEFEAALARHPADYDALVDAFRNLAIPASVTSSELTRLYAICFRLLAIEAGGPPIDLHSSMTEWQAGHLTACARDVIERTMYDPSASTRAWIERSREGFRARGEAIPDGVNDDGLPARLDIPFDVATAGDRIRPYLAHCEGLLATDPARHFKLCWVVARDGYPVFREVIRRWTEDLDARRLGTPGTGGAVAKAVELFDMADRLIPWAACERDILPLLDHPHPMVAAGAARCLGALYDGGLDDDPQVPELIAIMERLRGHANQRVAVAGGFVCGYDTMGEGLAALGANRTLQARGFDLDQWVIDILAFEKHTADLPNAQALWFYVHEHYAADAAFAMRLVNMDRAWIAMTCATELDRPVEGMRPILERLAADPDRKIAAPARAHLERHY